MDDLLLGQRSPARHPATSLSQDHFHWDPNDRTGRMKCAVLPMCGVGGGTMRVMPFRFTRGPGTEQPWERDQREVDEVLGPGCQKVRGWPR